MTGRGVMAVLLAVVLSAPTLWAQDKDENRDGDRERDRGGEQGGQRDGNRGGNRGGDRGRQDMRNRMELGRMMFMRGDDKDKNLVVSEQELEASVKAMKTQSTNVYALLVGGFDADDDGKLNGAECTNVVDTLRIVMSIRRYDENRDLVVDDEVLSKYWDQRVEMCERYNEMVFKRWDKDGDGALSAEEGETANKELEAMEARTAEMRARFGGRGGPPGGGHRGGHGGGQR